MTSLLSQSQVVAVAPNGYGAFDYSVMSLNATNLFAFASEHRVLIYDRRDFSHTVIETPDPTKKIIACAFCGFRFLYCCDSKRMLYKYRRNENNEYELTDQFDIGCRPTALQAGSKHFFFISGQKLFCCDVHERELRPYLMSDGHMHKELAVSPCGRAIAAYTQGGAYPIIWFAPYDNRNRFCLPVRGNIVDFKWGLSESMVCVTAGCDQVIRVWVESTDKVEFRCSNWFKSDYNVRFLSFCYPSLERAQPHSFHEAKSVNKGVFPYSVSPMYPLLVGIDKESGDGLLLETDSGPKLKLSAVVDLRFHDPIFSCTDSQLTAVKKQVETVMVTTVFAKSALTFHQTEISKEFLRTSVPYRVSFIRNQISRIETNDNGDIITVQDGVGYNWTEGKECEFSPPKVGACDVTINHSNIELISVDERKVFDIGFEPQFTYHVIVDDVLLVFSCCEQKAVVVIYKDSTFGCYSVVADDLKPLRVTFHSTDLFAVSESNAVRIFFNTGCEYAEISRARLAASNPLCLFLPHPLVVLAVASEHSLSFYGVTSMGLEEYKTISTAKIQAMKYIEKTQSLVIATKRTLFKLILPSDCLPKPRDLDSEYVVTTALSMCKFRLIDDFVHNKLPDLSSFVETIDAESFSFPSPDKLTGNLKRFCSLLPERWANVDDCGMRFLFTHILSLIYPELQKHEWILSVWALLSRDQLNLTSLLKYDSLRAICDSYLPLWAKNKEVLISAISQLVSKSMPKVEEVDDWVLLAVAIGKRQLAGQFAKHHGQEKLASFLLSRQIPPKKIENSAYAAQQSHRYSLSSMFFLLRGMKHQALIVLKSQPMLQVLIGRIVEEENWRDYIPDEFYSLWWHEQRDNAVSVLTKDLPKIDILSLELHRYCLLRQLDAESRVFVLNIQDCPYFVIDLLTHHDARVVERVIIPEPAAPPEPKAQESSLVFSFGASDWGVGESDFEDDYDSDSENSVTEPIPDSPTEKVEQVELLFSNFASSFRSPLFDSSEYSIVSRTEESLVKLFADVYNHERLSLAIKQLLLISEQMLSSPDADIPVVMAILFTIAYGDSNFNSMSPLMVDECSFHSCLTTLDVYKMHGGSGDRQKLSLRYLSKLFSTTDISESDVELVKYTAFHQMAQVLSSKLTDKHISMITSFLHHRHRIMFDNLPSCRFSSPSMASDLSSSGIGRNCEETIHMMEEAKQDEMWVLAVHDPFISPFFIDTGFVSSFSYDFQFPATHATGICINSNNNQNIAIAGNRVIKTMISQDQLDGTCVNEANVKMLDEWDVVVTDEDVSLADQTPNFQSPFVPIMPSSRTTPRSRKTRDLGKMSNWRTDSLTEKDVKAKCIDAHPTSELFVTGDNIGRVHIWDFDKERSMAIGSHRVCDKRLETVHFNVTGDRILCVASDGQVIVSDFVTERRFSITPNSRIQWLNADTQFVVSDPMQSRFSVYDILCDTSRPVATIEYGKEPQMFCPFDICNSHIAAGFTDGTVVVLDTRIARRIGHLDLHEGNITCVKYDPSGSFFMTGSSDNAVSVVEAKTLGKVQQLRDILPEYDPQKPKRGIVSLAISTQSIVAAGYSPCLHIWTTTGVQCM